LAELLFLLGRVPVRAEGDESRVRPADIARLCGDAAKLRAATGWELAIPLEQTLAGALPAARGLGARLWRARGAGSGSRSRERDACREQRRHRVERPVPGGAAAGEGLRGLRHDPSRL